MVTSESQRMNNFGVSLFEQGKFIEARNVFLSSLESLNKSRLTERKDDHLASRKISVLETAWSEAPGTISRSNDDYSFVWSRGLRIDSQHERLTPADTPSLVAALTLNSAFCLHMTCLVSPTPELINWVMRVYKMVLKLLPKTRNSRLVKRAKIAVYNNLASLHTQSLDYCEAFKWYAALSKLMKSTECRDEMVAYDRAGIITNLLFCCKPNVAGAA